MSAFDGLNARSRREYGKAVGELDRHQLEQLFRAAGIVRTPRGVNPVPNTPSREDAARTRLLPDGTEVVSLSGMAILFGRSLTDVQAYADDLALAPNEWWTEASRRMDEATAAIPDLMSSGGKFDLGRALTWVEEHYGMRPSLTVVKPETNR
jgi:hypothetical protein